MRNVYPVLVTLIFSSTQVRTKMGHKYLFVLFLLSYSASSKAAHCENGWTAYKDELCIKSFTNLLSYAEAQDYCAAQGNSHSTASLVMVKDSEIEDFLDGFTGDIVEYIWLGGKYDSETAEFKWLDGAPVTYTNWADDYPRITNESNACMELRPPNAKMVGESEGKWADVACERRNRVMCQRTLTWTLEDAVNEIKSIRKRHKEDVESLRSELEQATMERNDLIRRFETIGSRVVPVGSIYVEYYNQPSPVTLWSDLTWADITTSYAGLFFRASGGGSGDWGSTQADCAPRISQVQYNESITGEGIIDLMNLPRSGWSPNCRAGMIFRDGTMKYEYLKFNVERCEVRPKNQAIRIWRRKA